MDVPQRKPNRIEEYDYSQNGAYFITVCTNDRQQILSKIVGDGFPVPSPCGKIAEQLIQKIPKKYPNVAVDKYVIMPDHIHLLLRIDVADDRCCDPETFGRRSTSPTIGTVIGWYKYNTSKCINTLMNTPGKRIFQRSYYDHVIRNQQDYNEIWEYIDNNPCKWAITKQGRD